MNRYEVQSSYPRYDHQVDELDDLQDHLGRRRLARAIADQIRGDARPRVIGVYGSWGAGKSHLLSQTISLLLEDNQAEGTRKKQVIPCIFNPWLYEVEGDLAPGLIKSLHELEKQFNNDGFFKANEQRFKDAAKQLLQTVAEVGAAAVPGGAPFAKAAGQLTKAGLDSLDGTAAAAAARAVMPKADQVRDEMTALVQAILDAAYATDSTKEYRLVVFIDDLDRCSPENMVRMFEWLKVHLLVPGCIYVMALDHIAAARAIVGRYRSYLGEERDLAYGLRYLEKLIEDEYELGVAPAVEGMALRSVYAQKQYGRFSEAASQRCGGDFPGVRNMDELLRLRSLLIPRTMLKIGHKFERALDVLLSDTAVDLRNRLPSAYPFWTIFLIAMYYRLEPDLLDEFVRGRGVIYQLMSNPDSVDSKEWGEGPLREFCQYAESFGTSTGSGMQLPSQEHLFNLMAIIRENTFADSLLID